jgi:hypothetical protein
MATDLFGKPVGATPEYRLNLQQKRQATLLYHWMSVDYLKGLLALIDALIKGADVHLDLAKRQGRDALLTHERWGVRDTSANWSTHVFPALADFRKSTLRLIAWRSSEIYCGTGANQCAHMIDEHSSLWMTQDEEDRFKDQWGTVNRYAQFIDFAAGVGGLRHQLHDHSMALHWQANAASFPRLPRLRVHTDIQGETGKLPPRTGVYVPQDDPFGTLQFAWTGNSNGLLGKCQTLNELGRRVVSLIGRDAMWLDGVAMARYAVEAFRRGELTDRAWYRPGDEADPENAPWIVSESALTSQPCKWYFVEMIDGEFDDETTDAQAPRQAASPMRCPAGDPCPRTGFWFTPARANSRQRFEQGQSMPEAGSGYGTTIWQWDAQQG